MNWLSNCVSSPPGSLLRPPLPEPAVLPVKVLPLTVAVPQVVDAAAMELAELPVKVLSLTVNVGDEVVDRCRRRWRRSCR